MLTPAVLSHIDYAVDHGFRPCRTAPCTHDWAPAWEGDCKQLAALKLQLLLQAGAAPREFAIWLTRTPYGRHAVVVQTATGLVLDALAGQVEPMALKERHEGYVFAAPCDACEALARSEVQPSTGVVAHAGE